MADDVMKKAMVETDLLAKFAFNHYDHITGASPEQKIGFSAYLESVMEAADRAIFSGVEDSLEAKLAPRLNLIGAIYPKLNLKRRQTALSKSLELLDGLYANSPCDTERQVGKQNVGRVHEPLLASDIIINTEDLYWPAQDLEVYAKAFGKGMFPEEFDAEFLAGDKAPHSLFWIAYALSRVDAGYDFSLAREQFADRFPELVYRTKGAIAALTFNSAARDEIFRGIPKETGIGERLKRYAEDWHDGIKAGIIKSDWTYLPETLRRRENISKRMKIPDIAKLREKK